MSSSISKSDRGPFLPALLRLASQVLTEQFARWIATSGFEGVQPAHSAVIQPLGDMPEGARITTLARVSRMTKQSMSVLVSDLEEAGYVERVADPDDARATRVRLTSQGRTYARAVRSFARGIEEEWAKSIGAEKIAELRATLNLLRNTLFRAED